MHNFRSGSWLVGGKALRNVAFTFSAIHSANNFVGLAGINKRIIGDPLLIHYKEWIY